MQTDPYPRQRDIIPCCVHLRTKTQYCMPDEIDAGLGYIKVTTTGCYWCGKTHASLGPDDADALPRACQPGRDCFEAGE